jgi:nickel superoxide dismutase
MRLVTRTLAKLAQTIDRRREPEVAHAHCDVPCGLYDAFPAGLAARTVKTMVQKMLALPHPGHDSSLEEKLSYHNTLTRYIQTKEEHAKICKDELLILWTDYFNETHLENFPNLHESFWKATKLCSRNKREVSIEAADALEDATHEIAHMFEDAERAAGKEKPLSGLTMEQGMYAGAH